MDLLGLSLRPHAKRTLLSGAVFAAMTGVTFTPIATAQNADQAKSEDARELDVVVVEGYRQSLEDALNIKRQSDAFVDGLSAEGLADFPDLNLGEALQRITGVQLNRNGERRESSVAVRGLPRDFTRVEVNGQTLAVPDIGNVRFGAFQSDVISSIEVFKTPTAAMDTGGLAGTINLRTATPLSMPDDQILVAKVEGNYEGLMEETTPEISISAGKKFNNGNLALVGSLSWAEQDFRQDTLRFGFDRCEAPGGVIDCTLANDGDPSNDISYPEQIRQFVRLNRGDRISATGGLEWQINDQLNLLVNGIYSQYTLDESDLHTQRIDIDAKDNLPDL